MSSTSSPVRLRIRPKFSLLGNAFAAIVLATSPVFGVAYWFAMPRDGIAVVVTAHMVVLLAGLALVWRQLSIFVEVTATELRGNGIFSPVTHARLADIAGVHLVPTYIGASPTPVDQLLVVDAAGKRLFRLRGTFWRDADVRALAAALPVPLDESTEPLPVQDFFRTFPGSAYWFENSRPLQVAVVTIAALMALAAALWIMASLGLPVRIFE